MTLPGGPDLFTLRAWLSVERALEEGQPVDDAVAFLQDTAGAVFGPAVAGRVSAFLAAQPDGGDLGALLADDDRLAELLALLQAEDAAGEGPPRAEVVWSASSPRRTREQFRRAGQVQRRAVGMLQVRRPDVAGERSRRR
ncbi:hypothetical protein [Modestobacter sp. SYSU DS0290]